MAAAIGTENLAVVRTRSVEDRLFAEPYSFEFVQAVRLLQTFYPNRSPVGLFSSPDTELVRFGPRAVLTFPASEIYEIEQRQQKPPIMRINFMGLIGPLGVLPLYYTELVSERLRERDQVLRDFLDIFQHRMVSLFYRAWQKYRFMVAYEQGRGDVFSQYLLDMVGIGTGGLQKRQAVADISFAYYSGLLVQQPRSAEALRLLLRDYFNVPVAIEQFLGAWYQLDEPSQCNLDDGFSASQQLGVGAVVGDEIWDPQSRVRIVFGPLSLHRYLDFLPSGTAFKPLQYVVRFFGGDEYDFELQLVLKHEETPPLELGAKGEKSPQLGWVSWSKTREVQYDPCETILQL
jgi:type VI secretion system protein ImpH